MQEHNLFKNKIKQTKTFIGPNLRSKKLSLKKTRFKLLVNSFI